MIFLKNQLKNRTTITVLLVLVLAFAGCSSDRKERALFQRAMTALDDDLDGAAVEYLTQFLVKYPGSALLEQALFQRGTIYYLYESRYQEAVSDFRELLAKFPEGERAYEARKNIAEILEKKVGNCAGAIVEYQRLITDFERVDGDDAAQFRIASCYFELMNFEQSILEYQVLVDRYQASPMVPEAYFQIATVYQVAGRLAEAERQWRQYLVRYPEGDHVLGAKFGLASTLEEREELEAALAIYQEIFDDYENKEAITWRIERARERLRIRGR